MPAVKDAVGAGMALDPAQAGAVAADTAHDRIGLASLDQTRPVRIGQQWTAERDVLDTAGCYLCGGKIRIAQAADPTQRPVGRLPGSIAELEKAARPAKGGVILRRDGI